MIRVNLLRDKTETPATDPHGNLGTTTYKEILSMKSGGGGGGSFGYSGGGAEVGPVIKLLIIVVPVVLLYLYEMKINKDAQVRVSHIMSELEKTKTIRDEKKVLVDAINVYKGEFEARLPILNEFKLISKEKLHGIKILDQLQDLLPAQIWVTQVDLNRTQIDITGFSISDQELTVFQKNLEDSIYFENILIYNSIETKSDSGDIVISFKMKANFSNGVIGGG